MTQPVPDWWSPSLSVRFTPDLVTRRAAQRDTWLSHPSYRRFTTPTGALWPVQVPLASLASLTATPTGAAEEASYDAWLARFTQKDAVSIAGMWSPRLQISVTADNSMTMLANTSPHGLAVPLLAAARDFGLPHLPVDFFRSHS